MAGKNVVSSKKLLIKNVRCEFPKLAHPEAFQDGDPKYSIGLIMPKKEFEKFVQELYNTGKEIIGKTSWTKAQQAQLIKQMMNNKDGYNKYCLVKDGDALNKKKKDKGEEPVPHYEGCYIFRPSSKETFSPMVYKGNPETGKIDLVVPQTDLLDESGNVIKEGIAKTIRPGYYVHVSFTLYTYEFGGDPGISSSLNSVALYKRCAPSEMFGRSNPFGDEDAIPDDEYEGVDTDESTGSNPFGEE